MKKLTFAAPLFFAFILSCGRDENSLRRGDQQYEVVQESAGGTVTSTLGGINGVPPLTPVTATNVDTTTAFTLPSTTVPVTPGQPGTIAGTLPPGAIYRGDAGTPRPVRTPPPPQPSDEPAADTSSSPQPPVVEDPTPPRPTETSNEQRNEEEEAPPAEEPAPPPPPPSAADAPGTA